MTTELEGCYSDQAEESSWPGQITRMGRFGPLPRSKPPDLTKNKRRLVWRNTPNGEDDKQFAPSSILQLKQRGRQRLSAINLNLVDTPCQNFLPSSEIFSQPLIRPSPRQGLWQAIPPPIQSPGSGSDKTTSQSKKSHLVGARRLRIVENKLRLTTFNNIIQYFPRPENLMSLQGHPSGGSSQAVGKSDVCRFWMAAVEGQPGNGTGGRKQ